jgi:hypothetical protein
MYGKPLAFDGVSPAVVCFEDHPWLKMLRLSLL